ncbi:ABC transporter ATP-binding protein [Schaalia sp. 19OD2882]|uniref:ABC transporter ATP-binding protein n=1 Tax=Schaalia sp. 19OD2882 TaxID=2794089 RepID=UPI0020A6E461|nr:ABC transporter ATP-binding protein [Schaalia sp. 19OD2882]
MDDSLTPEPATQDPTGHVSIRVRSFTYGRDGSAGASPYGPPPDEAALAAAAAAVPPSLQDIDVQITPGTLTLLCGASGSGKSTVLRLLNGLVPHFHAGRLDGEVSVSGVDVPATDLSQAGRTTSTVFQNPRTQFFTPTVNSELAFRGENYGLDPDRILADCARALDEVGITHLWARPLSALSGGELQKVACAQALVADTPVLLLDEPTSNLSPAAIGEFTQILARMKEHGATIVIAEHRLHFLRDLVDSVHLVEGGRIVGQWSGDEFREMSDEARQRAGLRTLVPPADPLSDSAWVRVEDEDAPDDEDGVRIRELRFSYGRHPVLDIDALDLPAGAVSALVGDNGVGKSTLCRILVGLERPARGSKILLDGTPSSSSRRLAASAMVMQDVHRQLFSDTVRGEVTLGLSKQRLAQVDVDALLARFELLDLAQRHPLSLSGGQKQRLTVAASVARGARIHVFDEPTSGVDHRQLLRIDAQLRDLAAGGAVVLVVTHDPELVAECADRVIHLRAIEGLPAGESQVEMLRRVT